MEFGAALAGTYYLNQITQPPLELKVFVYYLWLIVVVEILGLYTVYAYFASNAFSDFIEETPFRRNYWLYNTFNLISYLVFFQYFIRQLRSLLLTRIFKTLGLLFFITATFNLVFSGIFFEAYSAYTSILGTLILVLLILLYSYELLRSYRILEFYKDISFYISIGAMVWHLCATPLFIYSKYFSLQSPDFVFLHTWVLRLANIVLYGAMIIGFIICSQNLKERYLWVQ